MAYSKVILNGTTLMDVTQKTVTSGDMLSGATALKNDGTDITGSIASKSSSDLTASGATVTAPAGYYASNATKTVASGTAGTPTASKGTVSNHSVSVTPSVTNTTGFITGDTKTGTAVTVSASELVSGTLSISSNDTYDVTNYASASVLVPSTAPNIQSLSITSNGTYTASGGVDGYSPITVNVSGGGGGGLVYETGTYTPTADVAQPTISFTNTHSTRPFSVSIVDCSEAIPATDSAYMWSILSWYDIFGVGIGISSSQLNYARTLYMYKTGSSFSSSGNNVSYLTEAASLGMPYYLTETGFTPYLGSSSRYFRSGTTYKWIAVWAPTT